jgi:ergothioneine biosynthesis protein EgtB
MSSRIPVALDIDRAAAIAWYQRNRARSRAIFDLIDPSAYYTRPISLRNPIVFYEGHLPAFSIISFLRRGLGRPAVDQRLEDLFARGIDPDSVDAAVPRSGGSTIWPSRDEVLAFGAAADDAVIDALANAPLVEDRPAMRRAQGLFTALEHEAMHQETLLYMWHRLPYEQKRKPQGGIVPPARGTYDGPPVRKASGGAVRIPPGTATLGADPDVIPFGWDNEFNEHRIDVPAFEIDVHNVTNAAFMEFVEAGGYRTPEWWTDADWAWLRTEGLQHPNFWVRREGAGGAAAWSWRGMFEDIPLPESWPVYVSHAEAGAYARWKGRRLPTEAEYHRAAEGPSTFPDPRGREVQGNFDFRNWEPVPVGSYPESASARGVHDLAGNGWEWTSSIFGPFDGFEPMASYPEYSAEFFDGQHYVIKGASPATARELVRPSFRNWFRPNYPYVYATFRTARS